MNNRIYCKYKQQIINLILKIVGFTYWSVERRR